MPKVSINVDVDDLQKGVDFYSAAVGLRPVRRFGSTVVELAPLVTVWVMRLDVLALKLASPA